ncbi:MAG: hypothetical protein LAO51_02410 [Acidobacteriia bacterium]|nr:hypothetical protein [Terriglobia bacterium]
MNVKTTRKARGGSNGVRAVREIESEYRFDYSEARPNRFARKMARDAVVVVLDADVAKVFRDSKRVNSLLRATIAAVEKRPSRRAG